MSKKRVLVWETLSTVSGGQKMTLQVLDMLKESCDFFCLIPGKGKLSDELDRRNIPYAFMGDQSMPAGIKGKQVIFRYVWLSLKNITRSLIRIARYNPDVLYAPGPAALPWSAICGMITGKAVIWHLHHVFLDGSTKKLLNVCARWKSVKKIIAVSKCVGEQINHSAAGRKSVILYNPVDAKKYASGNGDSFRRSLEGIFDLPRDEGMHRRIVIGHVALIQKTKRQDFVLDVVANLRNKGYDAIGVFPGEVREADYYDALKAKAINLGIDKEVLFLGRRNDIPDILKAIDILMIPSSFEGFPLAGLEAAAAGVPVVACNVAGAAEFVEVSGNGEVFSENSLEQACNAVLEVYENRDKYRQQSLSFAQSCSLETYATKIVQAFKSI
ncbi:MAG: glycosyltransferase [Clostridiales bacterium]|nr:glycosyltransferase [Clostridiales bacterium]MBE5810085.1 glycosyltransferase [Clostridiales bacterium]